MNPGRGSALGVEVLDRWLGDPVEEADARGSAEFRGWIQS